MAPAHDHRHDQGPGRYNRAFAVGIALNVTFVVVEVVAGLSAHSVALLADAGHNSSDVLSLLVAWGAAYLGTIEPGERRTYGLRRTSILAALVNGVLLLAATGAIAWEAVQRLARPTEVHGEVVIAVAALGAVVNAATALLFHRGRHADVNVRGAYLHMAADAAVSVAVAVSGLLLKWRGWSWVDPAASLLVVAVILYSTGELLWESINLALDAVPRHIDPARVREYLGRLPGIADVHDLHIWGMSTTEAALTVHLVKPDGRIDDEFLAELEHELHDRFGIKHATVQLEQGNSGHTCKLSP